MNRFKDQESMDQIFNNLKIKIYFIYKYCMYICQKLL